MKVLVTRRWPEEVEQALRDRFEVTLNAADEPLSQATLAQAMADYDVLCPTVSDLCDGMVTKPPATPWTPGGRSHSPT